MIPKPKIMTEESLTHFTTAELIDLMVKNVNELLDMNKTEENVFVTQAKQKQVQLIQKLIKERRISESRAQMSGE